MAKGIYGGRRAKMDDTDIPENTILPEGKVVRRRRKRRSPDIDGVVPPRVLNEIAPPPWVKLNEHATDIWNRVTGILAERRQLSADSLSSLEGLCQCYADWRRLRDFVEEHGYTYRVVNPVFTGALRNGELSPEEAVTNPLYQLTKKRPEASEFAEVDRRFRSWLVEFGLTDYSRSRIRVAPAKDTPKKNSGLEEYGL